MTVTPRVHRDFIGKMCETEAARRLQLHPRMKQLGLVVVASLSLVACGPSEAEARAYLHGEGYAVTSLRKEGGGFAFTATKGKDVCTGTVTIHRGIGSTSTQSMTSCERDTSACKPGAAAACTEIADELYGKDSKVFPVKAAELYRTACADRDARACARAAEFEAIDKNWDRVREFASKGCDLGSGEACERLALTEVNGRGTPKNEEKAIALAKKACDLSAMAGCRTAAGLLVDAEPTRAVEAVPLAEKACKAKYEDSCFVLGAALFDSKQGYPDALDHLDAACRDEGMAKKQQGLACNLAGAIVAQGLGTKKDLKRGVALFEKSCDDDYPEGCSNGAKLYDLARNKAKSDELGAKACALGKKSACR